jgi:2-polyprenyl-3-methyl-5-hydroxy-6-metoxy-1,4-benzoquinol methylase
MSKVLLALQLCRKAGVTFENKDIFDYGFGAGTFFRYCPTSSRLFGVELDPENVNAVRDMLRRRGFTNLDLRTIEIERWQTHPLLERKYDIILCSHVLEHLPDPVAFLRTMANCLRPSGVFLGLVPINERRIDPHHVQMVDRKKVAEWAKATGLRVESYTEADPWMYWLQSIIRPQGKYNRLMAQALSIGIGIPATLLNAERWSRLSRGYARLTASLPTQAGFFLRL